MPAYAPLTPRFFCFFFLYIQHGLNLGRHKHSPKSIIVKASAYYFILQAPFQMAQEQAGLQTLNQFTFLATIRKGIFTQTMLAESQSNHQMYAIKTLNKASLIENDEVKNAKIEKNVLMKAREQDHPFIARLISTFQSETRLFFVMEYCPGGDLMHHIQNAEFSVERSRYVFGFFFFFFFDRSATCRKILTCVPRFYGAEFCLVLKFLHENGIVYRDVKLDNILLTSEGHIQVVDFGVSAEGIDDHYGTTRTFCGTSEFIAPEVCFFLFFFDNRIQLPNQKI